MTVAVNDTIERLVISGAGPYPFSYRIFNDTDLQVYALSLANPPVPTLLTYLTHYTVTGANNAAGGSITLTSAAYTPYAGYTLDIRSNTPEDQPTSIRNQARFLPEIHEDAFDYLSRQIQDLRRLVNASIRAPDNEPSLAMIVPPVATRAGKFGAYDALGQPIGASGTGNDSSLRADLASTTLGADGARLVGFRADGSGSVARTDHSKLSDLKSVVDYGAVANGVTDNTAALIAMGNSLGGTFFVPNSVVYDRTAVLAGVGSNALFFDMSIFASLDTGPSAIVRALQPILIDMQAGALRSTSFAPTELDSSPLVVYTLASSAAAAATSITLTGGSPKPVTDQLIVVLGTDNLYYSIGVSTIAGNVVNLRGPLPVAVNAGANAWKFYTNEPHPNVTGYYSIIDYALARIGNAYKQIATVLPRPAVAAAVVTPITTNDTFLPSSTNVTGYSVTPSAGNGAVFTYRFKRSGRYLLRLRLNTGAAAVTATALIDGLTVFTGSINKQDASVVEIPCWVGGKTASTLSLSIASGSAIPGLSPLQIWEYIGETLDDYQTKKHVMLGDSWIAQPGMVDRLRARLPAATVVNAGVGGNTIADLISRFTADVASQSPNFVHIVIGTNDQYAAMAANLHSYYMQRLLEMCFSIGAIPIVYNSSVRSPTLSTARFDLSRQYYDLVVTQREDFVDRTERMLVTWGVSVPAGTTLPLAAIGLYSDRITVFERAFYNGATGAALDGLLRFSTGLPAGTTAATLNGYSNTEQTVALSPAATRFVDFGFANGTGAAIFVTGFAWVSKPDAHI